MVSTDVFSSLYPDWVISENKDEVDPEFWRIIDFFVLHSLCDGQSWKKCRLHDTYNWKVHPWQPQDYLRNKIDKAIWGTGTPQLYMAEKRELFKNKIHGKNLDENFAGNSFQQRAGFVKVSSGKGNDSQYMSLFYHIRNGFAHGRYGMAPVGDNDAMLFFEDGTPKGDKFEVTARIAILKSSLSRVIEVITNGPDQGTDYSKEIVDSILRGNHSKKRIKEDLDITEVIWRREIKRLSIIGKVYYDEKKWQVI